jgi:hypothetical protein
MEAEGMANFLPAITEYSSLPLRTPPADGAIACSQSYAMGSEKQPSATNPFTTTIQICVALLLIFWGLIKNLFIFLSSRV